MKEVNIVIVGAGAAGIAAACRLVENGFNDIQILEAENRIGGRIHTTDFGEGIVELGAQWVHGEQGNVVYHMANAHGLLGESVNNLYDDSTVFVESSGRTFRASEAQSIFKIIHDINESSEESLKSYSGSVGEYFTQEFQKLLRDECVLSEEWPRANRILEWYEKLESSIDGADTWFDTSGQGRTEYWECEGNLLWSWKSGGYRTVLDLLMQKYPDESKELPVKSKISFNKEVEKITWDNLDGCNKGKVTVNCSDGSVYAADHVIVTISLGVLKEKAHTLFSPKLPDEKLLSVKGLSIGTVDKIFLKFPHRWWPSDVQGFNFLWTEEAKKELHNCTQENDKSWIEGVFGLYSVDNQPNVLIAWIIGPLARHMEQLTDGKVIEDLMELLNKFLGKLHNIPQPDEIRRSTWSANPHFRGSYSFRGVETDKLKTCAAHLAAPVTNSLGKQVLLFAGEASHDHYYSTVHGAIETGWREAERLSMLYRSLSTFRVAIIGAGIAGLSAAKTLLQNGIDNIIVLEAQDHAGGRILSIPLEEGWIEAGAQWIHGSNSGMWRFANEKRLLSDLISSEGEGLYIREDGLIIESSLVYEVHNIVTEILAECEHFIEEDVELARIPKSIGHHLKVKFNEYLENCPDDSDEIKDMKSDLYDWHIRFQVIDNSCTTLDLLSAKAWGNYAFCGGTDYVNFREGYSSLISNITDSMPEDIVKYKCPVEKVTWKRAFNTVKNEDLKEINLNCGGVCSNLCKSKSTTVVNGSDFLSSQKEREVPVVIDCGDGSRILADHAIITCSLGHLKEHYKTMFSPSLPHLTEKAIEDLGFATINKIFLLYHEPWWKKDCKGFQLIWSKNCRVQPSVSEPSSWTHDLTGFDVLPTHTAVLLGWVGARGAELVEDLAEDVVGEHCTELLKRFTRERIIPKPHRVIRTKWHGNPYICGGYSNTSTACDFSQVGPSTLAMPVYADKVVKSNPSLKQEHPSLLFAGEATHEKFFSTTHGAYESGERQAHVITNYLKKHPCVRKQ